MNKKVSSLVFVLALAGSGPVLLAQSDTVDDLDDLSVGQLEHEITDELDDVFDELDLDPDGYYPEDQLERAILFALSDRGDDDDEDDVDYAELEEEMEEAGTTVEDVVAEAVEGDEESSYLQGSPGLRFGQVDRVLLLQSRNRRARTVVSATTTSLVRAIKSGS